MIDASGAEAAHRLHGPVVREIAVDLVSQQHETMALGQVDERATRGVRVDRPGGIVRVDDDQRPGAGRDERRNVIEIRLPAVRRVFAVVARFRPDFREHGRVEWVGRKRHQDGVAGIDQGGQRQFDALGGAGGDEHAIRVRRKSLAAPIGRHGFPRLGNPRGRHVSVVSVALGASDRLDQCRRRAEAERNGIADVEVLHRAPGCLDFASLGDDVADRVGEPVHAGRDVDGGRHGHEGF